MNYLMHRRRNDSAKIETQHAVDLGNLLVSEGFLPIVDKKGLTSVNRNLKYGEINCTDFCGAF